MIELPKYNWFVSNQDGRPVSNTFTGSCGTDPQNGFLTATTFNYKIWVTDVGKDESLIKGECFIQKPWSEGSAKEVIADTQFECSDEGIEKMTEWLNNLLAQFEENN